MNDIIKGILKGLEQVGRQVVPGGAAVDDAVHGIVNAKDAKEREDAIVEAVMAELTQIETIKPEMIADPVMFNAGLVEAHDAFTKIKSSLKKAE